MKRAIELVFSKDIQRVFDDFSVCFSTPIVLRTPSGEIASVSLKHSRSAYCELIRGQRRGMSACSEVSWLKSQEAAQRREMIIYTCHAGLVSVDKPIYFDGQLIGSIGAGQFRPEVSLPERVIRDYGINCPPEQLEAAWTSIPHTRWERIDAILRVFSMLVDNIVDQRMITLKGKVALEEITDYMEAHLDEDLTLSTVAGTFFKSPSTLYHIFKAKSGKSFKETLVEMRLGKAEQYMIDNPETSVAEAADKVGYADPRHFSRIYKRYRGTPPSGFLSRCREQPKPGIQ